MATQSSTKQVVPLLTIAIAAVVIVFTMLALWMRQSTIETDLLQRVRQALTEAGFVPTGVHFNGRDGVITGTVTNEEEATRLTAIASKVYGVRHIDNQLMIASSATTEHTNTTQIPIVAASPSLHVPSKQYPIEKLDLSNIQFAYSKSELSQESFPVLEQIVVLLKQSPDLHIEISAHTDNQGTALGNMAVTQARADSIRNYLLAQGVNGSQVVAQGYGSVRPVADNATDSGRQQNRRIEITVLRE